MERWRPAAEPRAARVPGSEPSGGPLREGRQSLVSRPPWPWLRSRGTVFSPGHSRPASRVFSAMPSDTSGDAMSKFFKALEQAERERARREGGQPPREDAAAPRPPESPAAAPGETRAERARREGGQPPRE